MNAQVAETTSRLKAYEWIKEEIESGRVKMGEPMTEMSLVKKIGVSRTPIREAMRVLEQEGYITIISNKGAFVSEISINDIKEIYEIRKLLEPFAALSAAVRMPNCDIDAMEREWKALYGLFKRTGSADISKVAALDIKLHMTLANYASNRRIGAIISSYHVQIKRFQRLSVQSLDDMQNSIEQHISIIECLKRRRPEELRTCLYDHIVNSEGYIMRDYFMKFPVNGSCWNIPAACESCKKEHGNSPAE